MGSPATERAVQEFASRVKRLYTARLYAAPLAERLLRLRAPFSGESLELPLQCTEGPNRVCALLKRLPAINEILDEVQAEVFEDAPGKVSVRIQSGFRSPMYGDGGDEYESAAILLHCLVARHRCVQSVQFLLAWRPRRGFELLFCDALTCTESATCLHLGKFQMNAEATCAMLAGICRLLPSQLRELALESVQLSGEACASLDSWEKALTTTTSLKMLKLSDVQVIVQETARGKPVDFVGTTLRALTSSSGISSLVVDASFAAHRHGATFKRMLVNPSGPVELTVVSHHHEYRHKANLTFEALVTSTAVKKLSMVRFHLGPMDAKALSKLLASSVTIEDISCAASMWNLRTNFENDGERFRWHAEHLVKGLSKTTSLRRLAINYDFFSVEINAVLTAARGCASLTEFHVTWITFRQLQPFYDALVKTGAGPKVTVGSWGANDKSLTSLAIQTWRELLSGGQNLHFGDAWNPPHRYPSMQDLCGALADAGREHVTSLEVCSVSAGTDLRAEEALAAYLPLALCLRKLVLRFPASSSTAHVIIGGIIQCKSIEVLKIEGFSVDQEDLRLLCDWLRDRRKTHSLELCLREGSHKPALENLASFLQSNYLLTRVTLRDFHLHKKLELQILNLVRRNYGLLRSAVRFALGEGSKRAAEAFELVSSHPQLLEAVQRVGSLSQPEAVSRIKDAVQRVHLNFWQLAGIVKEELVCNAPDDRGHSYSDGPPQLDDIAEHVLLHIRSFLKISDVLDEEPPRLLNEGADTPSARVEEKPPSQSFAPMDRKRRRKHKT